MTEEDTARPEPVPAELYDRDYFTDVEGYQVFEASGGAAASRRLQIALEIGEVRPGHWVLDVGCGRGEVLIQAAQGGAVALGIDYSAAGVEIARQAIAARQTATAGIYQANGKALPFPDKTFDRVFLLDLVEHLHPWELDMALAEVRRVLRPGGRCIIHTMPNLWYYRFGYPLYRFLRRLQGERLPANPRHRFRYHAVMHVNEQDLLRLQRTLRRAGFAARVWVTNVEPYAAGHGPIGQAADLLARLYPLRWFLCNDILAVATVPPWPACGVQDGQADP